MRRTTFWCAFGAVALAVVGGGAWYIEYSSPETAVQSAQARPAPAPRSIAVETAKVAVDTVIEELRAVGTLRPDEAVFISPEIPGRVARIRFREGEAVEAGAALVDLDSTILTAELAKARSDLTLARANHERATTLARQGTGTLRARDEAVAAYDAARANILLAEARLDKATIRAPLAGVVGLRAISVGAYVTPGDRIVELAAVDPLKADFRVPELAMSALRLNQPIVITADALPGQSFAGQIYAIDPVVDINGRAVRLRARVPNSARKLSPGLFVRVQIIVERRENAMLIPEAAIFPIGGKTIVYRLIDGRAVATEVELGQRRPGHVEIRKGLSPGETVITAGQQRLRDGSAVRVVGTAGSGA